LAARRQLGVEEHGDFGQRFGGRRKGPERRGWPAVQRPERVGVRVP